MNSLHRILVASSLITGITVATGAAMAAGEEGRPSTDKTQVVPNREDVLNQGAPTVRNLDSNAQRQHDRDSGVASPANTGPTDTGTGASNATSNATRDWNAIDVNKDNLIQPEEMETWLKQVGPQARDAGKS